MGRLSAPLIALLLAAAVAVGLSACGSSGGAELLPGATASEIKSNLDEVRHLVEAGECPAAADAATKVSLQVEELSGVDGKLKQALSEGAARLSEVVTECEAPEESTEAFESEEEEPEIDENEKPAKTKKPKPEKEAEAPEESVEPPGQEEEKGNGKGPP